MAMIRKHYRAFAEVIREHHESTQPNSHTRLIVERIASDLCRVFRSDNLNFDDARFLKACGIESR